MGLSVSRDVCKCTDLTAGIRVDFEAKEAAEDHPEGWFGASREPSTSYDGGHTDLPAKARYFLTQSTAISRKMFAPEVQGAFFRLSAFVTAGLGGRNYTGSDLLATMCYY